MAGAAALEVPGEAAAKRIAQRGAGELFDRALDRYQTENDLTGDEREFIRDAIDLVVDVETAFRFHVRSRGDGPELEEFGEAVRPLAERATELAVVAEMRSYKGRDEDVLDRAAAAADFFAVHLPDAGALSSATEAMEFHGECEPARDLIETVADEFE